ncbi:MAG: helix-turn-helix domain-containing protein [Polyangiaceae bacterium]|nr:helix-turn-helix domain-containing protein [Polyangiaceae bacterium]
MKLASAFGELIRGVIREEVAKVKPVKVEPPPPTPIPAGTDYIRVGEAARMLNCSTRTVRHYITRGHLRGFRVGKTGDDDNTKTSRTRYMPVHPVLAEILSEWLEVGWVEMMEREPGPDDLVVPWPKRRGFEVGRTRDKNYSRKMLIQDFVTLEMRHRRGHDLRRAMISLAGTDGARKDLLEV